MHVLSVHKAVLMVLVLVLPIVYMLQIGPEPAMWLQLLELCAAEAGCQPAALHSLAEQLVAQQQQIAAQQRQLVVQQQVASKQDAQIAGLHGQLRVMQDQLQELLQLQRH
jgi:hypothetical protein